MKASATTIRTARITDVPQILRLRAEYLRRYPTPMPVESDLLRWFVAHPEDGPIGAVLAYEDFLSSRYANNFFIAPGRRALIDAIRMFRWITYQTGADGLRLNFAVDARNHTFLAAVEATGMFDRFDYDPIDGRHAFRRRAS